MKLTTWAYDAYSVYTAKPSCNEFPRHTECSSVLNTFPYNMGTASEWNNNVRIVISFLSVNLSFFLLSTLCFSRSNYVKYFPCIKGMYVFFFFLHTSYRNDVTERTMWKRDEEWSRALSVTFLLTVSAVNSLCLLEEILHWQFCRGHRNTSAKASSSSYNLKISRANEFNKIFSG